MFIECYHKVHKDQKVQGFLDYGTCSDLENTVRYNVYTVLEDNNIINLNYTGDDEIDYMCIYAHGSRVFGTPRKDSDIDFVLFYKGSIREDDLFNIFGDEDIYIEHVKCDFNPIEIDDESDIEYYIQKHDIEYYQHPLIEKMHNLALALDDLEDNEKIDTTSLKDIIDSNDAIGNRLQLEKYFVDLGLPSKTWWCKFNLGCDKRFDYDRYKHEYCDCKADWLGDKYAWGELDGLKDEYTGKTYKYAKPSVYYDNMYNMIKYTRQDDLTQLLPEDDAAYQKLHIGEFKFHIPTKEQVEELIDNTSHKWKTNYLGYEGLNGMLIKSLINENYIFLPAAGWYTTELKKNGEHGVYWTSTISEESDNEAYDFWFDKHDVYKPHFGHHQRREEGISIRPVYNKNG